MRIRTALLAGLGAVLVAALAANAQVPGVNSTLNSVFTLAYDNSTMKPTYSASGGSASLPTSSTAVCGMAGSSTKVIKVRRIMLSGGATAVVTEPVAIQKRSTANSNASGTPLALTQVPYDANNSAGTAAFVDIWQAAPTLGTLVGVLADPFITFSNYTTGTSNGTQTLVFGQLGQPIVLRSTSQMVEVNLGGSAPSGLSLSCTFEWTEE